MARNYGDAVASLNTLQSNFATVEAIRKSRKEMYAQSIPQMIEWVRRIGYQPSDLDTLNAIHIAGTKGKGSTAAFVSSILNEFRLSSGSPNAPKKTGLFTSPHLRFVRERIQIDGSPLSEAQFAQYFYETWDRLESAAAAAGEDPKARAAKPMYFCFLTLMAFHTFKSLGVDAAIVECGIGGAYDNTNVLPAPAVTGITSLGIDHVGMLGNTLPEIAWHKAGIMKPGSKCFTVLSQDPAAKAVLEDVARSRGVPLTYMDVLPTLQSNTIKLGLQGDFQKSNASLAVALAREYLALRGLTDLDFPPAQALIRRGLETVRWAGRCDTRRERDVTWCIDGGHTLESIQLAGRWFADQLAAVSRSGPKPRTYLIFNQQTRERDAPTLALALHSTLRPLLASSQSSSPADSSSSPFDAVLFCTNTTYVDTGYSPDLQSSNTDAAEVAALVVQRQLAETWAGADPKATVQVKGTIEEAVSYVRKDGSGVETGEEIRKVVLVTGSLHLVGGVLEVLEGGR